MGTIEIAFPFGGQPARILKWRIRVDTMVSAGRVLFLYQNVSSGSEDSKGPEKKYRATRFGRVTKLLAKEGDVIQPGYTFFFNLTFTGYFLNYRYIL